MTTTLEQAEQIRTEIEAKLFAAKSALTAMDEKRISISFRRTAPTTPREKALDKMNTARARLTNEIESIQAALAEAQRRVDEAERDAELAAMSAKAERALEIGASSWSVASGLTSWRRRSL